MKALHRAITYCQNVEDLDLLYESQSGYGLHEIPSPLFFQIMGAMGQYL